MAVSCNAIVRDALVELRRRLPNGWSVRRRAGAMIEITAPDQRTASLTFEARTHLSPKDALPLVATLAERRGESVVVSHYLSEATRVRLRDGDVGYLDLTGNVRISIPKPGLFIETHGASQDPNREERPARSLRGAKAGRIVRALVDRRAPPGVRELAALTSTDAGYVSRVLSFLDTEALVERAGRGRIASVDWPALLRRWAEEAPLESRGTVHTLLAPRGLAGLGARLGKLASPYAITGSLAAVALAPIAPARLAAIWVTDVAAAAAALDLRPADLGANVMLVDAVDEGVFEGAAERDGVRHAAPSQVAADLLTSPGRGPQEAEALIEWMVENEASWRR